jgi:putative oxidoreductase
MAQRHGTSRPKALGLLALEILLAALFALQAVMKLGGATVWVARFRAWGYPEGFYLVVGAMEAIGALALVIPKTRLAGACLLAIVMVGAIVTHVRNRELQVLSAGAILVLLLFDAIARRNLHRANSP